MWCVVLSTCLLIQTLPKTVSISALSRPAGDLNQGVHLTSLPPLHMISCKLVGPQQPRSQRRGSHRLARKAGISVAPRKTRAIATYFRVSAATGPARFCFRNMEFLLTKFLRSNPIYGLTFAILMDRVPTPNKFYGNSL